MGWNPDSIDGVDTTCGRMACVLPTDHPRTDNLPGAHPVDSRWKPEAREPDLSTLWILGGILSRTSLK